MRAATAPWLWFLWTAAILVATTWPDPARVLPPSALSWDKAAHVAMFLPYGLLAGLSLAGRARRWPWLPVLAFPVLDELLQLPIPGRFCSPADVLANAAGTVLGLAAAWAWVRPRRAGR
ncbi:MAG: VanZ family protein [Deltaproteobacteria bacterium]|nr:VanZ family protein [Deltaproteobacteria bacterium]